MSNCFLNEINPCNSSSIVSIDEHINSFSSIKKRSFSEAEICTGLNSQGILHSKYSNHNTFTDKKVEKIEALAPISKNNVRGDFDKVVVVEVFSDFFDCSMNDARVLHEVTGNTEAGLNLAKIYHPNKRFIWALNKKVEVSASRFSRNPQYQELINLAVVNNSPEETLNLTPRSKVFIVAQGNALEEKIADMEAADFLAILEDDLGIMQIAELEFIVCKLGVCTSYLEQIEDFFQEKQSATNVIAYTKIICVDIEGNVIGFEDDEEEAIEECCEDDPLVYSLHNIDQIQKKILVRPPCPRGCYKLSKDM